ncbi:MAG TPA: hypothetical protein P5262_02415 [Candidatus Moranbacteria bacterium]|nr:hypothetical protein [Candidatus Moranbacteria bacterium]
MEKSKLDKAVKWSVIISASLFLLLVIFLPSYFFLYLPRVHKLNEKKVNECLRDVSDRKIKFLENRIAEEESGTKTYTTEEKTDITTTLEGLEKQEEKECYKKYPTKFQLP